MLAAAEADLEMQRTVCAEQPLGGHRAVVRHRDAGQEIVDQALLVGAQRFADRTAVKPLQRGRVAFLECRHAARPSGVGPTPSRERWRRLPWIASLRSQ